MIPTKHINQDLLSAVSATQGRGKGKSQKEMAAKPSALAMLRPKGSPDAMITRKGQKDQDQAF